MNTAVLATVMLIVGFSLPLAGRQVVNETDDAEEILAAATRSLIQHFPNSSVILIPHANRAASTAVAAELGLALRDSAVVCGEGKQPPACNVPRGAVAIKAEISKLRGDSAEVTFAVTAPGEGQGSEFPHLQGWLVKLMRAGVVWEVEKVELVLET